MFSRESGYVLKPPFMRPEGSPKDAAPACEVRIEVVCGFEIPKSRKTKRGDIVDPFVALTVGGPGGLLAGRRAGRDPRGAPKQAPSTVCKTRAVQNNGFNPQWRESWTWQVPTPELSFLLIQLFDERDRGSGKGDWLAQRVVRVSRLKTGFRVASLLDQHGEPLRSATKPGVILRVSLTPLDHAPSSESGWPSSESGWPSSEGEGEW